MAKRSKNQNTYSHGDWNVICDVCGFKYKASDIKKRWDNLYVCADDWEPRHPMDFQKGFEDDPSVPFTRPETYTSVATTYGDGDVTIAWEQDNSNIHEWDEELSEDATVTIDPPLITSEQIITIRKTNTDNTVSPDVDICGSLLSRFTTVEKQRNFGTNIHLWSMDWSANGKHLYLGLGVHKQVQNYRSITNDLLLDVPVPASSGYTSSLQNIGKVKNEGLEFEYYELDGPIKLTKDLMNMLPSADGNIHKIIFPYKNEKHHENFGLVFKGYIKVPKENIYTFSVLSNDGSRLLIADKLVVDHDGQHGSYEKIGEIALQAGFHKIKLLYFQAGGGEALKVFMKSNGSDKIEIPKSILSY